MQLPFTALLLFALFAQPSSTGRTETLVLPHTLKAGETVWLEVCVGVVTRGAEIEVTTTSGRLLGVISPYGIRPGNQAGTYTVLVPADAISEGRLSLRLSLDYAHSQRAPTKEEVKGLRVKIMDAGKTHL